MLRQGGTSLLNRLVSCSRTSALNQVETMAEASLKENSAVLPSWFVRAWQGNHAGFHCTPSNPIESTGKPPEDESAEQAAQASEAQNPQEAPGTSQEPVQDQYANLGEEELHKLLLERDATLSASSAQFEENKDLLLRSLADMENLRQRSARQAENSRKFAIQGFLKSMLDVGDNLERAYTAVPEEALKGHDKAGKPISSQGAVTLLNGLVNGVKLTEKIFDQGLKANEVEKFRPLGEKFNPNLHEALFEIPDATKEPGIVGAVTKTGYLLQGRVVRPAQVGVYKKP